MKQPTMVYRPATDDAPRSHVIENEAGTFEWMILDLDDGESSPAGWQSLPVDVLRSDVAETVAEPAKAKRAKLKLPLDTDPVTEDGNGDSD